MPKPKPGQDNLSSEPEEGAEKKATAAQETAAEVEAAAEEQWILPGRFRTAEEITQAYQELERRRGEQAEEIGDLRGQIRQYDEYLKQQKTTPEAEEETPEFGDDDYVTGRGLKRLVEGIKREIGGVLQPFQKQLAETSLLTQRQAIERDADYSVLKQDFEQRLALLPSASLAQPGAVQALYQMVKGEQIEAVLEARQRRPKTPDEATKVSLGRVAGKTGMAKETPTREVPPETARASKLLAGIETPEELEKWADPSYTAEDLQQK